MPTNQIGIVGGGLGGLAAAATLAARGRPVILFEKNSWLGGKAAVLEEQGYRFDMGPTILTLPSVLARLAGEAGVRLAEELELTPLDPQWRCFFNDGTTLDLVADTQAMQERLRDFATDPRLPAGYRRFVALAQRLHDISDRYYFYRSIGGLRDMLRWQSVVQGSLLGDLLGMQMGRTVAGVIRTLIPDERVAQMLDHFTQYVGSAPDQAPAVLCGIASMQTGEGVWYPRGGIRAVPEFLIRLCQRLGVELRPGTGIQRINLANGRVTGVTTEAGESVSLAAVVCNADTARAHRELLPAGVWRRRFERRCHEPACSGVVLYLGLARRYDHLLHHNFVFSADAQAEFRSIYRSGEPAPDPTCYVCAPAATDPTVAPAGGEALYVLVHAPYLRPHHDWQQLYPVYRRTILNKLAHTGGMEDLESRIRVERWLTPQDIHERYRVWQGAIYGLASHGRFTGAFKPGNRCAEIPGLYFAGGSAHPGPGMPMALMSGWIAADALASDGVGRGIARQTERNFAEAAS